MTRPQMAAGSALAVVPAIVTGGLVAVIGAVLASSLLPAAGSAGRTRSRHQGRCSGARRWPRGHDAGRVRRGVDSGLMSAVPTRPGARRSVRGDRAFATTPSRTRRAHGHDPAGGRGEARPGRASSGWRSPSPGRWPSGLSSRPGPPAEHPEALRRVGRPRRRDRGSGPQVADTAVAAALASSGIDAVASVLRLSQPDTYAGRGPSGANASVEPQAVRHERGLIGLTIQDGRLSESADEVVLGRATAAALAAEVGDRVTVRRIDGHAVEYSVVGIAVSMKSTSSTKASNSPRAVSSGLSCPVRPPPAHPTTSRTARTSRSRWCSPAQHLIPTAASPPASATWT